MSSIKIGIIGGSGLNKPDILQNVKEKQVVTPFGTPSASLQEGEINGVKCVLLPRHGRDHSIMPSNINYRANLWALKEAGCTHILVSTATGSLQEHIKPGDFVVLDNFIDRTKSRAQTFFDGQSTSPKGVCHIPMEPAFCERTRAILIETINEMKLPFHSTGTCVTIEGPRFSSKAESLMFKQWGAHVVNMTTVPEVCLAKELGLCYAAIALVTDYDCWRAHGTHVCVEDVLATFKKSTDKLCQVFLKVIPKIAQQDWMETIQEMKNLVTSNTMQAH